jgi:hypothetical protein
LVKKLMKPSFGRHASFSNSCPCMLRASHHRAHVAVVEGGQQRGGVLRALQAAGDGLAQARHLDPFLAARLRGRPLQQQAAANGEAPGAAFAAQRSSTSSLVIRPSLPVPLILLGSMPSSSTEAAHSRGERQVASQSSRRGFCWVQARLLSRPLAAAMLRRAAVAVAALPSSIDRDHRANIDGIAFLTL